MNFWISSIPRRLLQKADRPRAVDDEVGEQLGRLGEDRAAAHRVLVDHRRIPDRDPPLRARGAVGVDERELGAGQPLGELDRVGDRRRGEDEARVGAVDAGDAPQPAQDVGDVRAEDAAVGVRLVDDDPAQVGEEVAPALVVGRARAMLSMSGLVRMRFERLRMLSAVVARGVAVVDRVAQRRQAELGELARLVLGERLGRVDVERPRLRVGDDRVEHRQVERQRLARGGAAGDDHVAGPGGLECLELVRVEPEDAGALERARQAPPRDPSAPARSRPRAASSTLVVTRRSSISPASSSRSQASGGAAKMSVLSSARPRDRRGDVHRVERLDIVQAQHLGALLHRERGRGQGRRPAVVGLEALVP